MVKTVGKYQIGKTLGEGTFGKVKFAINSEDGEHVAIKVLDKEKIQKQSMGQQIKREISIMKLVSHKSIVKLTEVLASRTKIFIVIELVTGGELFDCIVAAGRLDEVQARKYFRQLVDGVKYCHSKGVCHRDLKPENLLLDEAGDLKISDFGLSALYDGDADGGSSRSQLLHTTCGTPNYVAPEVLADKGYDGRTADVWSCGVILYVLCAGFLPFDEPTMTALFRKIQSADFAFPSWFGAGLKELLGKILVADPKQRITLSQVADTEWFLEGGYTSVPGEESKDGEQAKDVADDDAATFTSGPPGSGGGGGSVLGQEGKEAESKGGEPEVVLGEAVVETEDGSGGGAPVASSSGSTPRGLGNSSAPGLKRLNAFDLINQCGGIALNRMLLTSTEKQVVKVRQFTSSLPPLDVLAGIDKALQAIGCDTRLQAEVYKAKGALLSSSGMIGIIIQSYAISDSMHLVEIRRGKGDILEYYKLFNELVTNRINHLINIPVGMELSGGGAAELSGK